MICIEFTAKVEDDLDLISDGTTNFHTIIKKVYEVFSPTSKLAKNRIIRTSANTFILERTTDVKTLTFFFALIFYTKKNHFLFSNHLLYILTVF